LDDLGTRPDFAYSEQLAVAYIDGPHHEADPQRRIDKAVTKRLRRAGYTVIRFPKERTAWSEIFGKYAHMLGTDDSRGE
jgi:very-short-patch-repair endonuclease